MRPLPKIQMGSSRKTLGMLNFQEFCAI